MAEKTLTVRLSAEQADLLDVVARVQGVPVVEVVRRAISTHLDALRDDPDFQSMLLARRRQQVDVMDRLTPPRTSGSRRDGRDGH